MSIPNERRRNHTYPTPLERMISFCGGGVQGRTFLRPEMTKGVKGRNDGVRQVAFPWGKNAGAGRGKISHPR